MNNQAQEFAELRRLAEALCGSLKMILKGLEMDCVAQGEIEDAWGVVASAEATLLDALETKHVEPK